jgi:hypothetical protein
MNKNIFLFLTLVLLALSFTVISGCGKYMAQYSAPVIIERFPAAGAGGVGSGETLWVKFSKSMDTSGFSVSEIGSKIKFPVDMTATATFYPDITPEMTWSDDDTKLTMSNFFFIANPGNKVHFQTSKEAFQDTNGQFVTENADLLNYTLAGLNIVSRNPSIDAVVTDGGLTSEVVFNNPVDPSSFLVFMGPDHTAGAPTTYEGSFSNSNTTLSFEVSDWPGTPPVVVDITYEAIDIFGNLVTNGQLVKYIVQ